MSRRELKWVLLALASCASALLVVTACAALIVISVFIYPGWPFCPIVVSALHLRGAQQVSVPAPCYVGLRLHCAGFIDYISPNGEITSARSSGQSTLLISEDGTFYSINTSDGIAYELSLPYSCAGVVARTVDGSHLACVGGILGGDGGTVCTICFGTFIDAVSLLPGEIGRDSALVAPDGARFSVLAWSPNQRHLAVVRRTDQNGPCALALYAVPPEFAGPATLSALLSPSGVDVCQIQQVAWSPDGAYIAWISATDGQFTDIAVVSVASLPAAALTAGSAPVTIAPTYKTVIRAPQPGYSDSAPFDVFPYMAWMPQGETLTVTTHAGYQLVQVDVASMIQRTLLSLPASGSPMKVFSWLDDGQHVAFAIGHYGTQNCEAPRDALYVYTMPGSA